VTAVERDLRELAAIPAPTGAEAARIEWLERRLADAPGARSRDAVGNLVWRLGSGHPQLAVLAHVDTVFDAEVPHQPRLADGWLHGPGIGDNTAAVVVALNVFEQLADPPAASIALVFTVGEEGLGNLRGALHACAELRPEAVIALEGHGLESVGVDAVGSVRARLEVTGPGGHSWWARGRPSALHGLIELLHELLATADPSTALNIGTVSGGGAINAIAARAKATIEARSLDERALDGFAARLAAMTAPAGLELAVEPLGRRPAGRLDRDHALLAAVREVRAELGLPDGLTDGSTDANAALAHGIPALALGCARGADMHLPSERIEVASLELGAAQLAAVLRRVPI
jgi:acetylornithine deacetylase/succinyl-diaminopimelate desuccinylase-like protein